MGEKEKVYSIMRQCKVDILIPALDAYRHRVHIAIAGPVGKLKRSQIQRSLCVGAHISGNLDMQDSLEKSFKNLKPMVGGGRYVEVLEKSIRENVKKQAEQFFEEYREVAGYFLLHDLVANWETLEICSRDHEMTEDQRANYDKYEERAKELAKIIAEAKARKAERALKANPLVEALGLPKPGSVDADEGDDESTYKDMLDEETDIMQSIELDLLKEIEDMSRDFRDQISIKKDAPYAASVPRQARHGGRPRAPEPRSNKGVNGEYLEDISSDEDDELLRRVLNGPMIPRPVKEPRWKIKSRRKPK